MEPIDKKFMKMAMLRHEETFKHQVHELHRLYKTQKKLMKDIDRSNQTIRYNQEMSNPSNGNSLCYQTIGNNSNVFLENRRSREEIEEESEIELTLGPTSHYRRKKEETMRSSECSGPSFTSSSSSAGSKRTGWGLGAERNNSFHGDHQEQLSQEKQQQQPPNWLLQSLSLKMK